MDIPAEPAFLLFRANLQTGFAYLNRFRVAEELDRLTDGVASAKAIRGGAILVRTHNAAQSEALFKVKSFHVPARRRA